MHDRFSKGADRVRRIPSVKWQTGTVGDRAVARAPLLPEFLEEQLWALRDRANALDGVALPEPLALHLALVGDELTDAGLLLRRPTRTNREGVIVLIAQMRRMLEAIEREAWPNRHAG